MRFKLLFSAKIAFIHAYFCDINRIVSITFSSKFCHTKSIVSIIFSLNFSRILTKKNNRTVLFRII